MRNIIIALLGFCTLFTAAVSADELQIKEDAPDRYVVVKGDTLWAISGRFLKSPWRWPEIWQLNKDEIKNPHWIYPGDVVLLDRANGTLRLAKGEKYRGRDFEKREPQARVEPTSPNLAIPLISPADIGPFLSQPLVIEKDGLEKAPRIIANEESRVVIGAGNRAYVVGLSAGGPKQWHVFRPGKALIDPDTKKTLGYEAVYLGDARVLKFGDPSTVEIIRSTQEILRDDRLVAATNVDLANFVPHAPQSQVRGRIMAAYEGVAEVGRGSIITLNVGSQQGLEIGNVLAIQRAGIDTAYRSGGEDRDMKLPEERIGLALVFRVFDHVSYALVMRSDLSIRINDTVVNP
jgi:hypothetical protein